MAKLIGTDPNQVPTNADLGSAAYADTQNMPEARFTNQPLSAKFGANGDVPTNLATTLDFVQISGSTFIQTGSDAQAFIKTNNYWNGAGTSFVDTTRGSTTIRLNQDNAGVFQFETAPSGGVGTLNRLTIDEDGHVTTGYQPAFLVTTTTTTVTTGSGAWATITMNSESYDTGGNFASNTFTAPVTGKYQMNVQLLVSAFDTAANYYVIDCSTSNRNYHYLMYPGIVLTSDGSTQIIWSFVADMDAGDTAFLRINQNGGTLNQTTVVADSNYTRWTGYLLG